MKRQSWRAWCVIGLIAGLAGCGGEKLGNLEALKFSKGFTLYSLDPATPPGAGEESFNGFRVLGKTEVADARAAGEISAALHESVTWGGIAKKCFYPRHGIQVIHNGVATDYVICFQCWHMRVLRAGEAVEDIPLAGWPEQTLDEALKKAGVKLAAK